MKRKLLLLLFILCLLPTANVWAQTGTYTANGVTWKYQLEGSPKTATITGEVLGNTAFSGALNIPDDIVHGGTHYTVTKINDNAFRDYEKATTLSIPTSVTTIGKFAFSKCKKMTGTLYLPNVTTIGDFAFAQCGGLTGKLEIPNVTTIGQSAFISCIGLTGTLYLPNVTTIGASTFFDCRGLSKLKLPNVTTIAGQAFYNCIGLTGKLELPNVTTIGNFTIQGSNAFRNCKGLTSISLPKVTMIGGWTFASCEGLEGVLELPKTLTSIGEYAFMNSSSSKIKAIKFENGTNLLYLDNPCFAGVYAAYIDMTGVNFPPGFIVSKSNLGISGYTMVYLPSTVSINANDINVVRGNLCNKLEIYDAAGSYHNGNIGIDCPIQYPFTAATATYNRVFYSAYLTLYLPYPATLPDGMRAYTLEARTTHGGVTHFRFTSVGDGGTQLEANKPYLVRVTDGSPSKQFGTDVGVQVPVTPSIASTEVQDANGQGFYFGGTTENIDNATAAGMKAYNLRNNQWRPIRTDNPNGYIHSFRAYMRTTGAAPAKGFAIVLDDEDTATDIDDTVAEDAVEQGNSPIYTLDGKLMGTDIDALPSGEIYIKNGKKFYKF